MTRFTVTVLGVAALLISALPAAGAAPPSAPRLSTSVTNAAPDYATETFGDPWDYDAPTDILLDGPGPSQGITGQAVAGGRLRFDAAGPSYVSPLFVTFPSDIPEARSGPVNPITAGRYTTFSMSAFVSRRTFAAITWFGCRTWDTTPCEGGRRFVMEAGWHTYTFALENEFPGLTVPWSGQILGLRLAVAPDAPATVEVDWLRLFQPTAPITVNWDVPGGAPAKLFYDTDDDPSNNLADRPGWGAVGATPGGGTQSLALPAGAYPPGGYRFYVESAGERSAYSEPLLIHAPPQPVIDDPDVTGGQDYATAVLGDPWDMSNPQDFIEVGNARNITLADGILSATNGPPNQNDPYVRLTLGPGGLDPSRYHRLTVNMSYDGPFGLDDAPGGGAHGRLIWWLAETGEFVFHDGRTIVTWTDRSTYTVDLAVDAEEPSPIQRGWGQGTVTYVRWDLNEDPGARSWRLDNIALRADDEAPGSFAVRYHDARPAGAPPATVSLFADTDASGFDGTLIASGLPLSSSGDTFTWNTAATPGGTYWLYMVADDGIATGRAYATGPLRVLPGAGPAAPATPPRPAGSVDRINQDDSAQAAIAISERRFATAGIAAHAVLARVDEFADALAGAPLTADGPLLLTGSATLDTGVLAELRRVLAPGATVYLLGGTGVLSDAVASAVTAAGFVPRRLSGPSRVETSIAVAEEVRSRNPDSATVLLARAAGPPGNPTAAWADSVAGGAAAARSGDPVVVTQSEALHPAVAAALQRWRPSQTVLLGGTGALSDAIAAAVPGAARVAGPDRAATAAAVAARGGAVPGAVIVPGFHLQGWAFGFAAAGLSADLDWPVLLANFDSAPPATLTAVRPSGCTDTGLVLIGAIAQISRNAEDALAAAASSTC